MGSTSSSRGMVSPVPSNWNAFSSAADRPDTSASTPAVRFRFLSWITASRPSPVRWTSSSTP